jgi:hypothetical protein
MFHNGCWDQTMGLWGDVCSVYTSPEFQHGSDFVAHIKLNKRMCLWKRLSDSSPPPLYPHCL